MIDSWRPRKNTDKSPRAFYCFSNEKFHTKFICLFLLVPTKKWRTSWAGNFKLFDIKSGILVKSISFTFSIYVAKQELRCISGISLKIWFLVAQIFVYRNKKTCREYHRALMKLHFVYILLTMKKKHLDHHLHAI